MGMRVREVRYPGWVVLRGNLSRRGGNLTRPGSFLSVPIVILYFRMRAMNHTHFGPYVMIKSWGVGLDDLF